MPTILRIAPPLLALAACTVPEKLSSDEVDPDAPQTFLTQVPAAFAPRASELHFEADREATFECSVDGAAPAPCTSPFALELDDGPHEFAVAAIDGAHRDLTPATAAWTVDGVPPRTYFTATPPGAVADNVANFAFASEEEGVTFECRLDGVTDFACTSPLQLTVDENLHSLRVTAIDRAGQRDRQPPLCTWVVDLTAPAVTFLSGPSGPVRHEQASFELAPSEPNLTYSCRLDGGTAATCVNPVSFSWLAQGAHSLAVTATDAAGNASAPVVRTWTVDTVAPETTISVLPRNLNDYDVFLGANETGVTYTCSIDDGAFAPCDANHSVNLPFGSHVFRAIAQDAAGNSDPEAAVFNSP